MAKRIGRARVAHRVALVVSGCLLAAVLAGSASAVDPTFTQASGSPITTGSGAIGVEIADFNGDTRPDLAIANQGDNNVSILIGNGSGGFGAPTNVAVGTDPVAVVAADLNGAAGLDLAVVNENDGGGAGSVSILLGSGTGTFTPGTTVAVGTNPQSVAVADLNGAAGLDLAVVNEISNNVSILLGNGNGTFGAPTTVALPAGATPQAIAAANLNGAGGVDLAVANEATNNVSILLGDGSGGFPTSSTVAAGTAPNDIAVADLNGAGGLDLIVANADGGNVSILLGNGSGGFSNAAGSPFAVGASPEGVTAADFNLDGKRDLAVANSGGTTLSILVGDGSGGFTPAAGPALTAGGAPTGIAAADLTGDTKPDLVTANYDTGNVTVQLNTTPAPPTAVMLRAFAARATPKGVELRWRTGHEAGLLGFHVYRAGVKLNRTMITARGWGTTYRLLDRNARIGVTSTYRLQAVRVNGTRAWVGRVRCPPNG